MKKGALSIEYTFVIFIALIAVIIIIGVLTNWSFGAKRYIEELGGDKETEISDIQWVKTDRVAEAIQKHLKLCEAKCGQGLVKSNLCYAITDKEGKNPVLIACQGEKAFVVGQEQSTD